MFHDTEEAIRDYFGKDTAIRRKHSVSGGDINEAYHLSLTGGEELFLKVNARGGKDFFQAEAEGLKLLKAAGASVPKALTWGETEREGAFLLMEYVRSSSLGKDYWVRLGHMLGEVHRAAVDCYTGAKPYGLYQDNFIGLTRQKNTPHKSWITFFRDNRLGVQMKMALHYFDAGDRKACRFLLDHLGDYLPEPDFPSLLHGDLWGGNVMADTMGAPLLIDPAVYVGHHEADLAMTELFGGFAPAFYGAYHEVILQESGYAQRRELYNLYHLLNHLNLFGSPYLSSVRRILKRYGA